MMDYENATARCWAEIDLSILRDNFCNARALLQPETELICVVKANAYGNGAVRVARELSRMGAHTFAVAAHVEAMELVRQVPGIDVLTMGMTAAAQYAQAIDAGVIMTVFDVRDAAAISRAAVQAGKPARVEIKVETGLNRLGIPAETAGTEIAKIAALPKIDITGMFTHLALRSRESDDWQLARFERAWRETTAQGVSIPRRHACDSIGMVRYPEYHFDAVRTGAWLYGVCPSGYAHPEKSRLIQTVKARVAQVHRVPAGQCLGYDEDHPLTRDSVIATLAAGYIDGYPRVNGVAEVELHGRRAPVAGLVCMDQMMVDVTDIPGVQAGDAATLLGGSIGVNEYAAWGRLNRNEALCRVGRRVPRIYRADGEIREIAMDMEEGDEK